MLNKILEEDFRNIIQNKKINFNKLRKKTFLISGANGFIATYIISFLIYLNKHFSLKIKIIIVGKNSNILNKKFIKKETKKFIKIIKQDISDKILENRKT